MGAEMTDELDIRWYAFLPIIHCHNGIGYEENVEEKNLDSGMVAEAERKRSI